MTQETKTAFELFARYKRMKANLDQTEQQTRLLKDGIGGDLRFQLIHEDVKKLMDIGEELKQYCQGKPSIKRDLQAAIQKIDAKIRTESAKFDQEHKSTLERLHQTIRRSQEKNRIWGAMETVFRVISWLLAIGWVVFYFFVASKDPADPTFGFLKRLFYSEIMLLFIFLPPALLVGLGSVLCLIPEHFSTPNTEASRNAKEQIASIEKKRAELIASIEKEKEEYLELLEQI